MNNSFTLIIYAVANQNVSIMITRVFSLFILIVLAASCGQQTNKTASVADENVSEITVEDFLADAGPFIEKPVSITGTVVHVCRHGGQRLFIVGEDGEERIRITVGDNIPEFDVELEGSMIEVNGIARELIIDETYLAEWEDEVSEGSKQSRGEGHEGGVGHGDDHDGGQQVQGQGEGEGEDHDAEQQQASQLKKIQDVRDEIAASGKDHLSDYWIETIEFKVLDQ